MQAFQKEKALIEIQLDPLEYIEVEHFGSTSIEGLIAKPIIDILIEIPESLLFDESIIRAMTSIGYHYFKQTNYGTEYMIFVKGYYPNGTMDQLFHIHMCIEGHAMLDQLFFRDYLRKYKERSKAYQELKLELAKKFEHDRVGYRKAKTAFITEAMKLWEAEQA